MTHFIAAEALDMTRMFVRAFLPNYAFQSFSGTPNGVDGVRFSYPGRSDDVTFMGDFSVQSGVLSGGEISTAIVRNDEGRHSFRLHFDEGAPALSVKQALEAPGAIRDVLLKGADAVQGSLGADTLAGFAGADTISGKDGADRLVGGAGADRLIGGVHADTFDFNDVAESTLAAYDTIADFSRLDGDRIDLRDVDANAKADGNQDFFWGGSAFNGAAGELIARRLASSYSYVEGDVDGDAKADFRIVVMTGSSLTSSDFLF